MPKTKQEQEDYKPKQMRFKGVPEDVYKILIRAQAEMKGRHMKQFSLEQTVYSLIRKSTKSE